ncbi:MlaD family protein [Nocardia sp. NBC_01503]|uniref:MlaD family protein n=1 Tax=Nocardia sp. NBC_01503 TaxID=2975997 RepID=UPI002E7AF706|nr:MlaD family protein [Nocardia sp. NBC_01503]WTL32145.1 MlaD family protein [Nocardia sp. NBC_01503]
MGTAPRQALWRLIVAAAVTVVLFGGVVNALRNPVIGDTVSYTADFADVSGLRIGADVRRQGVQVGKVTSIDIRQQGGTNIAVVGFALQQRYRLTSASHLAVRYQNLSGLRYLDFDETGTVAGEPVAIRHATTQMTTSSFDITTLFHGLEPVLRTLDPAEIDKLAENVSAFLAGDGTGAADLAAGVKKIADYTVDRQQVVSTLVANIAAISNTMKGKSDRVLEFIENFDLVLDKTMTVLDQFYVTATYGPAFVDAVNRLLTSVGLREGTDLDALLKSALAQLQDAPQTLRMLPSVLAGLEQLDSAKLDTRCANGPAVLPQAVQVLLAGQQVVLCNR